MTFGGIELFGCGLASDSCGKPLTNETFRICVGKVQVIARSLLLQGTPTVCLCYVQTCLLARFRLVVVWC